MRSRVFLAKVFNAGLRKADATIGRLFGIAGTLEAMAARPFELHLELTNLCNADCTFCPYHTQTRAHAFMSDAVFEKAVADYVAEGGGSVSLTPVVGDALIHRGVLDYIRALRARPEIDRIVMVTNCILADRYGADEIIGSGLTQLTISIAGFDEAMYRRVYRSKQYPRVKRNVLALLEANRRAGSPVNIVVGLRPDRPLAEVMAHPDLRAVLDYGPTLDFTWSYATVGGRVDIAALPETMRVRRSPAKREACVQLYIGPIVLPDGRVMACQCIAAVDAPADLVIGHLDEAPIGDIWRADRLARLRAQFGTECLNPTCSACDAYRGLDLYRTREGRERARINRRRLAGEVVHRERARGAWDGG